MKTCFKCGAEKPLTEFYKHPAMADGRVNKCKECNKKDVKENRALNSEYYLNYDRNRPNTEERNLRFQEACRVRRESDPEYKKLERERSRKWWAENPIKGKAHSAVSNGIRDGKITKPSSCEHCGSEEKRLQGHHWSYDQENWLDVIWLCSGCHGKEHKRLNELGRDPDNLKGNGNEPKRNAAD